MQEQWGTGVISVLMKSVADIRECANSINIELRCTDAELIQDTLSVDELIDCGDAIAKAARAIKATPWCFRLFVKGGAK